MAHIPVEKKAGTPWWLWLLALLLLLPLLAFFLFGAFDDDDVADAEGPMMDTTEAVVDVDPPRAAFVGTIDELSALVDAEGIEGVTGRRIDLDDVRVRSVSGDSTFVVSPPGSDDRFVVVMRGMRESETGDGTGSDGLYDIDEGDVVSIDGSVVGSARMLPREAWGMTEGDVVDAFYLRATRLDKQ